MLRKTDTGLPFELRGSEGLVGPEVPPPQSAWSPVTLPWSCYEQSRLLSY